MLARSKEVPDDIKAYFAEAYSKSAQWKLPNGDNSENSKPAFFRNVTVIGGGTMGRGIAISMCLSGSIVVLVEQDKKALEVCAKELKLTIEREVALKRFSQKDVERLQSAEFELTTDLNRMAPAELVIEAVFENMELKKQLFSKLDKICMKSAIFGSNTSSLNIDEISSVLENPSRLVGIHFFNPAHVIRMVEVVHGKYTSGEAVATAFQACKQMKKLPILVGNCPNFVFNRLLFVYLNQAEKLMYQYGLMPQDVDAIVTSFGFLMGPITVVDMNGIDVGVKVKKEQNMPLNVLEVELIKRNRLGRKTGKGVYSYNNATRKKTLDPEIENLIQNISKTKQVNIQLYSDSDIMEFLLYPMINEGFLCIEESMIEAESLLDMMFILGFGWPARTGGPMKWGRQRGLYKVAQKLNNWYNLEPTERSYKISATLRKIQSSKI